jgi:hypothetical protein
MEQARNRQRYDADSTFLFYADPDTAHALRFVYVEKTNIKFHSLHKTVRYHTVTIIFFE